MAEINSPFSNGRKKNFPIAVAFSMRIKAHAPVQLLPGVRYGGRILSQQIVAHAEYIVLHVAFPVDTLNVDEELVAVHRVQRVHQSLEVLGLPRPLVGGEVLQGLDGSVNLLVDRCQAVVCVIGSVREHGV